MRTAASENLNQSQMMARLGATFSALIHEQIDIVRRSLDEEQADEPCELRAVAELESHAGASPAPSAAQPPPSREAVTSLLGRARELRAALAAPGAATGPAGAPPAAPPEFAPPEFAPPAPGGDVPESSGAFLTVDTCIREDLVENGAKPAETREAKDFLLLEGLEPGARHPG